MCKNITIEKNKCDYKRGGMCLKHDRMGTKYIETSKVWTDKKDGMFWYVHRRKTKYIWHFAWVAFSNLCNS